MEQQLDGNMIALDQFLAGQDKADLSLALYGEQAFDNCVARVLKERTDAVIDVWADDPIDALGASLPAFRHALAAGDAELVGKLIVKACDQIAESLVTNDERDAEIDRLKEMSQ